MREGGKGRERERESDIGKERVAIEGARGGGREGGREGGIEGYRDRDGLSREREEGGREEKEAGRDRGWRGNGGK